MTFLILLVSLAALAWSIVALIHGSIYLAMALFLGATACLPAEFFSLDAGGLTLTLDRLWFVVLLVKAGVQWYRGNQRFVRLEHCDIAVALFTMWLVARTITQPLGSVLPNQPPTLMHLIIGYLIPIALYVIVRCSALEKDKMAHGFWGFLVVGLYLGVTAFLEIGQVWSLVFPKYISDPNLGIHFGRARGPMLQSVRLGMVLVSCWVMVTVYSVWLKPWMRSRWVFHTVLSLVFAGAVYLTYTRSVWMGFGAAAAYLTVFGLQGTTRRIAIFGMMLGTIVLGVVKGPDLLTLERGTSGAETKESTYMRSAFAYVSVQMFKEKPIAGYGFNQFQVYNRPFLSDRSTNIRLDSIRGYVHHNGFLSLVVDLGMIGFALYSLMIMTFIIQAFNLWSAKGVPKWVRGLALIAIAVIVCHHIQMAFHELSFASIENSLLFIACGMVVAANQQFCLQSSEQNRRGTQAD